MNDVILGARHWQVFLLTLTGLLINNTTFSGNLLLTLICNIVGFSMIFGWMWLLGIVLTDYLPEKIEVNRTLFLINGFLVIVAYGLTVIFTEGKGFRVTGPAALIGFYFFFALVQLYTFPMKVLVSLEKHRKASLREYIGETFLMLFFPIGVWFIQPRVNKIKLNQADF